MITELEQKENINNLVDILRILETDYKILSVKDTVKVRVLFKEVEVPLDLWTQAIMINGLTGEIA